jgi:hypothetical protein
MAAPFATLQKGINTAVAGDTVWIRGGTYRITTGASSSAGVNFNKSGTSDTNRIKYWAYPGEVPVFDFSGLVISTTGYTNGFNVSGSWIHLKGIEVANVPMNMYSNNGISVNNASNDIFESLNLHHNNGTGLFIGNGMGGHLILNSDSHDNYDPNSNQGNGQNADGFGVHYQTAGNRTIIRGCRAWWNSDDGYDFISQEVPVTIENSWAMGNGYINSGTARGANGNGFKIGSSKTGIRHVVRNCLAWGNPASGFYANHSSGGNDWFNNTSYNNGTQFNMLASTWDAAGNRTDGVTLTGDKVHRMRNNVGFPNDNTNMQGVENTFNTWNLNIVPANADFVSVMDAGFMGPRQADGSLPNLDFMKLRATSQLIDKGTNVGLPFAGTAPDLGCYEVGLATGGTSGAGGIGGVGGAGMNAGGMSGMGAAAGAGVGGAAAGAGTSGSSGSGTVVGGSTSTGGVTSTGGSVTTGGAPVAGTGATSGGPAGGADSTTGGSSAGGVGTGGASGDASSDGVPVNENEGPAGCGCRVGDRGNGVFGAVAAIAVAMLRVRRRPRRAR